MLSFTLKLPAPLGVAEVLSPELFDSALTIPPPLTRLQLAEAMLRPLGRLDRLAPKISAWPATGALLDGVTMAAMVLDADTACTAAWVSSMPAPQVLVVQ